MLSLNYTPDGSIAVSFKYDARIVNELKQRIPSHMRRWDRANKLWLISPTMINELRQISIRNYGIDCGEPLPTKRAFKTTMLTMED